MSNSKKDFAIVTKLFMDLINNLSEEQYNSLIKGTADIRYFEKGIDNDKKEAYYNIIYHLATEDDLDKKINFIKENKYLSTKSKLLDFCKYYKIDFKVKDTNDTIVNNIIQYVDDNKENIIYRVEKAEDIQMNISDIANKLENIMDVEEARTLIAKSKVVENKTNILKLAKKLNVFIDRESSYEIIVEHIIKSVVEAKIRSYTIRKKI
ncbi:hypothetical protein [Clostridioides sp. GD02404]|uniref:hypothetical protein n=1 Tax=Clostridioides sp. GD02404 TaxID=3054354 RepID=UPI0038A2FAA4